MVALFGRDLPENAIFGAKNVLKQYFKSYFRTSFPVLECPILFKDTLEMLIYKRCVCGSEVRPP